MDYASLGDSHREKARTLLRIESGTEDSKLAQGAALAAIAHALLDVADAIREQNEHLINTGVRTVAMD